MGLTIALCVIFTLLGCGPEGLGWAQSIGAVLEIIILLASLQKRSDGKLLDKDFWQGISKMAFATVVSGCVAYSMTKFFPLMATDDSVFVTLPKFALITISSIIVYILAGYFLNIEKVQPIFARIKKVLFKNV